MKRLAALLALLVLAAGTADAAHTRRPKLRGHAHRAHAKAPKRWQIVRPWATPRPAAPPPATATATATATAGPTAPGATAPPLPQADPRSVSVGATEFAFTLSQPSVAAGNVRVQFDNSRAEDAHQLVLAGNGDTLSFDVQDPGVVTRRTFSLTPGTYHLFCPLDDHEARGMSATLTVRQPGSG